MPDVASSVVSAELRAAYGLKADPLYVTRRRPERPTRGGRVAKTIELVTGLPAYPWQRYAADVAGERLPSGRLAYPVVIVTVPRQVGKTTLLLGEEVDRCTSSGAPQTVAYTMQSGSDAKNKLLDDQWPMLKRSPLAPMWRPRRAAGSVALLADNGSRIEVRATEKESGHGSTIDMGGIDEAFADVDDRREASMAPAMDRRPDSQLFILSTAGNEKSVYFRQRVELGRAATLEDSGHGVAHFEWGVGTDEDWTDESVWRRRIPSMTDDFFARLRLRRMTMTDPDQIQTFRRNYLNQWVDGVASRLIPTVVWEAVCSPVAHVDRDAGPVTLAVDCDPDRVSAALTATDGQVVEVVYVADVPTMRAEAAEIARRWRAPVAYDSGGPAADLGADLENDDVATFPFGSAEVAKAAAGIYDAIADRRVTFRTDPVFEESVQGLAKKSVGDRWLFARRTSSNASPFIAASLALHGHKHGVRPVSEEEWTEALTGDTTGTISDAMLEAFGLTDDTTDGD